MMGDVDGAFVAQILYNDLAVENYNAKP